MPRLEFTPNARPTLGVEIEVALVDEESAEQGIREAGDLMDRLGIQPEQLIEGAYLDLLSEMAGRGNSSKS